MSDDYSDPERARAAREKNKYHNERAAICGELRLAFSSAFGTMLLLTDEELEEAIKARWEVPTTTPSTALGAIAAANDAKQALIVIGARS